MVQPICTKCGADLIPGAAYCRQCGQPTDESSPGSELATAILGESKEAVTTKLLDSRPTTPGYNPGSDSLLPTATSPDKSGYSWPKLFTAGILVLILVVVSVGVIWSLRARSRTADAIQINKSLIYPGARTIVDMSDSGGAVLQLETPDSLDKVREWYEANLKPTKTLRVTSTSVIQKNANVTVTLVSEDKLTSIVIKQVH
jgi:zinc-ribbon domain